MLARVLAREDHLAVVQADHQRLHETVCRDVLGELSCSSDITPTASAAGFVVATTTSGACRYPAGAGPCGTVPRLSR
jgi:hypothetical protein